MIDARRLPVGREPVDQLLEVLDVAHEGGHDVAVVAGHAVALDDLGAVARERRRPSASWRGAGRMRMTTPRRVAERARVDVGAVAA